MYCRNCGNQMNDGQRFCTACGAATGAAETVYEYPKTKRAEQLGPFSAWKLMFKGYAGFFNGRSRRSEYWYAVLANFIIIMAAYLLMFALAAIGSMISVTSNIIGFVIVGIAVIIGLLLGIYSLAAIVPSLALAVRRLHDIGKSGWYLLMGLIPLAGGIIMLVFMVTDSDPGNNQYGENPKGY